MLRAHNAPLASLAPPRRRRLCLLGSRTFLLPAARNVLRVHVLYMYI